MNAPGDSWWKRNWKWFVPVGCGTLFLGGCAFVVGIFAIVVTAMKSSDAYAESMTRVNANPAAIEALGAPVEAGYFITGSINVNGADGDASISIPVSGPKGKATLYTVGTKSAGTWTYSKMEVEIDSSKARIDLGPEKIE